MREQIENLSRRGSQRACRTMRKMETEICSNWAHAGQITVRAMRITSSRSDQRPQAMENESGAQLTDQELAAKICGSRDPCAGLGNHRAQGKTNGQHMTEM
jgi:hypothetical protein